MGSAAFTVRNATRGTVLAERARGSGSFRESLQGLMFRSNLAEGEALWLPGVNNIHMFFMRFAIDAVFVGAAVAGAPGSRDVVAIRAGLRPWRDIVWWVRGGHGVLELREGAAAASDTAVGDRLVFGSVGPGEAAVQGP